MINFLRKIRRRIRIEYQFRVEQQFGLCDPGHEVIPKHKLTQYIPETAVIVDAGAHIGSDSVELSRLFPKATIYSFEPIPSLFTQLCRNTRKYRRIHCIESALSGESGTSDIYVSSGGSDASSSLRRPLEHLNDHPDIYFETKISVKTKTLDDWASEAGIVSVDFLWLDLQGQELEVLKSSPAILRTVKAIHSEVCTREMYAGSPLYGELREFLEERGFRVAIEAIEPGADAGNVLFVRIGN